MLSSTPQTLLALKAASKSKSINERQAIDRQRDCLVLIHSYLQQCGYFQAASALQNETSSSGGRSSVGGGVLSKFETADNIDLMRIISEYEDYCEMKFKQKPKFCRPSQNGNNARSTSSHRMRQRGSNSDTSSNATAICTTTSRPSTTMAMENRHQSRSGRSVTGVNRLLPYREHISSSSPCGTKQMQSPKRNKPNRVSNQHGINNCNTSELNANDGLATSDLNVRGLKETMNTDSSSPSSFHDKNNKMNEQRIENTSKERIIKPLPSFGDNFELRSLAASIQNEIIDISPEIKWDDIIALDNAKILLKEAVVLPVKYPDLFTGLLVPWKGILLYGAPGNGKTLLAKAVATESETTFFNISASSIVSKFRGESEKLIKVLFDLARYHSPSTIFIDEIDSIMGQRGSGSGSHGGGEGNEHEGSRRMKTELLIEMDGLNNRGQHVFVLAASNMPWDLDQALLRRLEKRIYIPMPDQLARTKLLKSYLSQHVCQLEERDFDECAEKTQGYNAADIKILCKEAAMKPVRLIFAKLEKMDDKDGTHPSISSMPKCTVDVQTLLKNNPITSIELMNSFESTKPSADPTLLQKYKDWSDLHGSM